MQGFTSPPRHMSDAEIRERLSKALPKPHMTPAEETLSRMVGQRMSPTYQLTCLQFRRVIEQYRIVQYQR